MGIYSPPSTTDFPDITTVRFGGVQVLSSKIGFER